MEIEVMGQKLKLTTCESLKKHEMIAANEEYIAHFNGYEINIYKTKEVFLKVILDAQ